MYHLILLLSTGYDCEKAYCKFADYMKWIDYGYYPGVSGECATCQKMCDTDDYCGAVECGGGKDCAWWKVGRCTKPVNPSNNLYTCQKSQIQGIYIFA